LLYLGGIIFFCYFYTSIIFNPNEIADNMRKYGGFIPGIRPGKLTAEYVSNILTRITLVGALYLALVAIIPEFMITGFHVQHLLLYYSNWNPWPLWIQQGLNVRFTSAARRADRRYANGHGSDGGVPTDRVIMTAF
jgi:preprotein translocase subunit SecY